MNLKLIRISIANFKGIQNLVIDFGGENTCIYGANATGKTTIVDAYLWCLFGKNHKGESSFNIKPLENGKIKHKVENEVELILSLNDIHIAVKKIQKENWVRKRNSEIEELKGNEIAYYIDNVPRSAGEYKNQIDAFIKESIFKVLSNPEYFNTVLTWEQRREVITRIAGDITNAEVSLQSDDFIKLMSELNGKSLSDKKKEITNLKAKLKDDASNIPARIDECLRKMPEICDEEQTNILIAANNENINQIDDIIKNKSKLYDEIHKHNATINSEISSKIQEIEKAKQAFFAQVRLNVEKSNEGYYLQQQLLINLQRTISQLQSEIQYLQNTINTNTRELEQLGNKFDEIDKNVPTFDDNMFSCPTCKRPFDETDVNEKKKEIVASFNLNKANELKSINEKGQALKADLQKNTAELKLKKDLLLAQQEELLQKSNNNSKLIVFTPDEETFRKTEDYTRLTIEIEFLKTEIKTITEINTDDITEIQKQKTIYFQEIDKLKAKLLNNQNATSIKNRVEELNDQLLLINQQIADLEKTESIINRFVKTKISMVEEKVNKMFTYVKFKMYNILINGNEEPTCEALINGVPYNSANAAAQKNAGIDIINTLSDYYHLSCPIFLDNAESTNQFIKSRGQTIKLYVIEPCPTSTELAAQNYKDFYLKQGFLLT
jgi:DNA repair protein SbcC/Rad50